MNDSEFFALIRNEKMLADFLSTNHLVDTAAVCPKCQNVNTIKTKKKGNEILRCANEECRKRIFLDSEIFILNKFSFLSNSQILEIFWRWSHSDGVKKIVDNMGLNSGTVVDWLHKIRQMIKYHFDNVAPFGRRIYSRNFENSKIEKECKEVRMFIVEKRDAKTLIPLIQKHVLPGTEIVSDEWKAYNSLNNIGYDHFTVNHSKNFVDPTTSKHTQLIERLWGVSKKK